MKRLIVLIPFLAILWVGIGLASNDTVQGIKKPDICLKTNIRCVLKQYNNGKYWCLKSNIQRNLDARRNSKPIKKTYNGVMGNCAKRIPIYENVVPAK